MGARGCNGSAGWWFVGRYYASNFLGFVQLASEVLSIVVTKTSSWSRSLRLGELVLSTLSGRSGL